MAFPGQHGRYGWPTVHNWKFESWNEPDLREFNTLHFSFKDYMQYLHGVRQGLRATDPSLRLRGPAGLFRPNHANHPMCWGLLRYCETNRSNCPIDTLTYHRKGDGTAAAIVNTSIQLIADIRSTFPGLSDMPYVNSEADPTTGWSHPLPGNANVQYAATLVETVLLHLMAAAQGPLRMIRGISHDNSFLGYHPFEFGQRTLFAHFQMNDTGSPPDVQLFAKPAYAAMGMLAVALAARVASVGATHECIWASTWNDAGVGDESELQLAAVLLVSRGSNVSESIDGVVGVRDHLRIRIDDVVGRDQPTAMWFVEFLEHNVTDPHRVWFDHGSPAYPDAQLRLKMRNVQYPIVLIEPQLLNITHPTIEFRIDLIRPWVVAVRICPITSAQLASYTIRALRAVRINDQELMLFWSMRHSKWYENRCVRSYQIFYRRHIVDKWERINGPNNPFMMFHHTVAGNTTVRGFYSVRAVSMTNRFGNRSKSLQYL